MTSIMIVEDEDRVREVFVRLMKSRGYEVWEAANGQEAVDLARVHAVDLVVMDVRMPKLDGVSALHQIRAARPAVKAALITGYSVHKDMELAGKEEQTTCLQKPFIFDQLIVAIDRLLAAKPAAPTAQPAKAGEDADAAAAPEAEPS